MSVFNQCTVWLSGCVINVCPGFVEVRSDDPLFLHGETGGDIDLDFSGVKLGGKSRVHINQL